MKSRFFAILLAVSLGTSSIMAQSAAIAQLQRAKKTAVERVNKFKECLTGKRPCTAADFAAVTVGVIALYGIFRSLRKSLPAPQWSPFGAYKKPLSSKPAYYYKTYPKAAKEAVKRVPYYADPAYWTSEATEGLKWRAQQLHSRLFD